MSQKGWLDYGKTSARDERESADLDELDAHTLTKILSETDERLQDIAVNGEADWHSEALIDTEVVATLTGDGQIEGDEPTIDDLMDSLAATTLQFEGFPDQDLTGTFVPVAPEETAELLAPDLLFPQGKDDD